MTFLSLTFFILLIYICVTSMAKLNTFIMILVIITSINVIASIIAYFMHFRLLQKRRIQLSGGQTLEISPKYVNR